jgi:filamentous hemagglutinin family protein
MKIVFLLSFWFILNIFSMPSSPKVISGNAGFIIEKDVMNITCSDKSRIYWEAFNIDNNEKVSFVLPAKDAYVLNKVIGSDLSLIFGKLESNGKIFLLNPNGIFFSNNSKIEVSSLIVSTLDILDEGNLDINNLHFIGNSENSIVNMGSIKSFGDIYVIAKSIKNSNEIISANGDVSLFAGNNVLIKPNGSESIFIASNLEEMDNASIDNSGLIKGNNINLNASSNPYEFAIKHSGSLIASSTNDASIDLVSDKGKILIQDGILESKNMQDGGSIKILAKEIVVEDESVIDASNINDGGSIYIGGELNNDAEKQFISDKIYVGKDVNITSSSKISGNGGNIYFLANDFNVFLGNVFSNGGIDNGNGGFVEISSKKQLYIPGKISTKAFNGENGNFYIDPTNVVILNEDLNVIEPTYPPSQGPYNYVFNNKDAIISSSHLVDFLNDNNVTIDTDNSSLNDGNIDIQADIIWSGNTILNLRANKNIYINGKIDNRASLVKHLSFSAIADTIYSFSEIDVGINDIELLISKRDDGELNLYSKITAESALISGSENTNTFNIYSTVKNITGGSGVNIFNIYHNGNVTEAIKGGDSSNTFKFLSNSSIDGSVIGGAGDNALDYSGFNAGIFADLINDKFPAIKGLSANINNIIGDKNYTNTIQGPNLSSTWTIGGINSGTLSTTSDLNFSNFSNLIGGGLDNTFNLNSSGALKSINGGYDNIYNIRNGFIIDTITGGIHDDKFVVFDKAILNSTFDAKTGGVKELNYQNYNDFVEIDFISFIASGNIKISNFNKIVGDDNYFGMIKGPNYYCQWNITSQNSGIINEEITFSNISDLLGSNFFDIFHFSHSSSITGSLDGQIQMINTLDYSDYGSLVNIDFKNKKASGIGGTFKNIDKFIGPIGYDNILMGSDSYNIWDIAEDSKGFLTINNKKMEFTNFNTLLGGSKEDFFNLSSNAKIKLIDTSIGNNYVNLYAGEVDVINCNGVTILSIYEGFNVKTSINGLGQNEFIFCENAEIDANISGDIDGINILNYRNYNSYIEVDLTNSSATGILGGISNINFIKGDKNLNGKLRGPDSDNIWSITAENEGNINNTISFSFISDLVGSNRSDTFAFMEYSSISGIIDGENLLSTKALDYSNVSSNILIDLSQNLASKIKNNFLNINSIVGSGSSFGTLIGFKDPSSWSLSGLFKGSITAFSGISFSNINYIIGGSNNETFNILSNGSIEKILGGSGDNIFYISENADVTKSLSGAGNNNTFYFDDNAKIQGMLVGGGTNQNILDYSAYTSDVFVDFKNQVSTGIVRSFEKINNVVGSNFSTSTLVSPFHKNSWKFTGKNSGYINGSFKINYSNFDILYSGSSEDRIEINY